MKKTLLFLSLLLGMFVCGISLVSCDDDDAPTSDGPGSGTATAPYNVTAALGICKGLQESTSASASYTSDEVYVKGRVSEIGKLGNWGQLIYYISDDGTTSKQLEIYYGNYLNGAAFTSANQTILLKNFLRT